MQKLIINNLTNLDFLKIMKLQVLSFDLGKRGEDDLFKQTLRDTLKNRFNINIENDNEYTWETYAHFVDYMIEQGEKIQAESKQEINK